MENKPVHVIGAGLAGSEAAWQLVSRGVPVVLHEMKPQNILPRTGRRGLPNWFVPTRCVRTTISTMRSDCCTGKCGWPALW